MNDLRIDMECGQYIGAKSELSSSERGPDATGVWFWAKDDDGSEVEMLLTRSDCTMLRDWLNGCLN